MAVVGAGAERRRGAAWGTVLLVLCAAGPASTQVNQLVPRDEAWLDPQLVLVRYEIIRAALRRDTAALRPNLNPEFLSSFGGDGGIEEFFRTLESPGDWYELVEVLSFGGSFVRGDRNAFGAPAWQFDALPCDDTLGPADTSTDRAQERHERRFRCDPFDLLIVLGTNVRLRDRPGGTAIDALTLALVAKDRLRPDTRSPDGELWTPVILPTGTRGWIAARLLRSPLGKRAHFVRGADGRWRMRSFVAGD